MTIVQGKQLPINELFITCYLMLLSEVSFEGFKRHVLEEDGFVFVEQVEGGDGFKVVQFLGFYNGAFVVRIYPCCGHFWEVLPVGFEVFVRV